jgi:hypothetical protein
MQEGIKVRLHWPHQASASTLLESKPDLLVFCQKGHVLERRIRKAFLHFIFDFVSAIVYLAELRTGGQ